MDTVREIIHIRDSAFKFEKKSYLKLYAHNRSIRDIRGIMLSLSVGK